MHKVEFVDFSSKTTQKLERSNSFPKSIFDHCATMKTEQVRKHAESEQLNGNALQNAMAWGRNFSNM